MDNTFFSDDLLLSTPTAKELYLQVRHLPIIDYHCHLDPKAIQANKRFSDLGELWLSGDHYKWRAMRLCGVDEQYITGNADYKQKYLAYARIFPKLCGSPLYYWTQLELKKLFGIREPLNAHTAESIWQRANDTLKTMTVADMLSHFKVEYIATTDDATAALDAHGVYSQTAVCPTFRPDKLLVFDKNEMQRLVHVTDISLNTLDGFKNALIKRLDFFAKNNCRIADHGMDFVPTGDIEKAEANMLYQNRDTITDNQKHALFSHILSFLASEYQKRDMAMQLHFATFRRVNTAMTEKVGADAGFDVMQNTVDINGLTVFLDGLSRAGALPKTILYSLDPTALPALATLSGAFHNVRIGAAWWFNDTVSGIRRNLETVAEYAVLGTNLGMLTDSRSFSSYARFDFFRRILADFVGGYVERGEYDKEAAILLMKDICYHNIKDFLGLEEHT